jgi:hypothetical protein
MLSTVIVCGVGRYIFGAGRLAYYAGRPVCDVDRPVLWVDQSFRLLDQPVVLVAWSAEWEDVVVLIYRSMMLAD